MKNHHRPAGFRHLVALLVAFTAFGLASQTTKAFGQSTALPEAAQEESSLNEHLSAFGPYIGKWVCEDSWVSGGKFWAMNEYSKGMKGNFVNAITWTKNEEGKIYQRYQTKWVYDKQNEKLQTYGFTYDGTVTVTSPELTESEGQYPIVQSRWQQPDGTFIKQQVQMNPGEESYSWKVWSSTDETNWTTLMDGTWKKQQD